MGARNYQNSFWFAPKIDFVGVEDIRFAKGWENIKSDGFWALVFAWDMNLKTKPTATFFEDNLKLYFDGLMKVVNEDVKVIIPKTEILFSENEQPLIFKGILKIYDAFTTKKVIELNVTIEVSYCEKSRQYIPLFKMAPKEYNHSIWKVLKSITLREKVCK